MAKEQQKNIIAISNSKPTTYGTVCEYISIYSKKPIEQRDNKSLANLKKIKRQIEYNNAQNDEKRVLEIIKAIKGASTKSAEIYIENNMDATFEEETKFIELLDLVLTSLNKK